jgi:hypothetical protein
MQNATGQPSRENQTGKSPTNPGRFSVNRKVQGSNPRSGAKSEYEILSMPRHSAKKYSNPYSKRHVKSALNQVYRHADLNSISPTFSAVDPSMRQLTAMRLSAVIVNFQSPRVSFVRDGETCAELFLTTRCYQSQWAYAHRRAYFTVGAIVNTWPPGAMK